MGTFLLQQSADALRASLAKEVEAFCDQLNLSFQAHLIDMSSSIRRLLLADMELLLDENTKLREELEQSKSVLSKSGDLRDTADANVPAEDDNQEAPCSQVNKANSVYLMSSSVAWADAGSCIASLDALVADANLQGVAPEQSANDDPHRLLPSTVKATNFADKRFGSLASQELVSCSLSSGRIKKPSGRFGVGLFQGRSTVGSIARRIGSAIGPRTLVSGWRASSKSTATLTAGKQRNFFSGWRASRMSSVVFRTTKRSMVSEEELASVTSILFGMKHLKSDDPSPDIYLLPQWEDIVRSAVNHDQVQQTGTDVSFTRRESYVENHFKWARHPASSERFCWEGLSMFLVLWDMLVVPLAAFDIIESPLSFFAFIFWNLDIIFSMVTGYQIGSRIEMRLRWTACHYLQTWFAFDLLVIAPEWVLFFLGSEGTGSIERFGNLALALRVLKVSKLLRVLRLLRAWTGIRSRLRHHATFRSQQVILQFVKLSSMVLLFIHYSACVWYAIGNLQGDDGWVSRYRLQSSTVEYKYLTSFHWAMSQFHGSMDVHAATSIERVFSLVCEFFGMVAASLFISSITSLAMRAQKLRQDRFLRKVALLRYLEDNHISTKLMMQINTFVSQTTDDTTNKSNTVELLKILPSHLRVELAIEVKIPVLEANFVSRQMVRMLPGVKKELCAHVVKEVDEKPGRLIFEYKEASHKAFIVWKGQALYSAKDEFSEVEVSDMGAQWAPRATRALCKAATRITTVGGIAGFGQEGTMSRKGPEIVEAGTCIAQMNLFTSWHHRGECILRGGATAFAIDAEDLNRFLMAPENYNFALVHVLAKHALGYIQFMRLLPPTDLNDLFEYPDAQDM